jgi:[CysO sulfur-carrier protein]-S-L-cysteine hydrolase
MRIARSLLEEIVQHARADAPDECCGMFGIEDDAVVAVYPTENIHHSPQRFEIDGRDVMRITDEVEDRGMALGLYHSHTMSRAYPSQTDVNFAQNWPGVVWLIVSMADPDAPALRAYTITGAEIEEVALTVE